MIDRSMLRRKRNEFDYQTLSGNMISVELIILVHDVRVRARMDYIEELNYPLMYVSGIENL